MLACGRALAETNASIEASREQTMIIVQSEEDKQEGPVNPFMLRLLQLKAAVHALVTSSAFDHTIMGAISFNTVCLAIVHYNQPVLMTDVLEYVEYVFTGLFLIEALLKIFGLGPAEYFTNASCIFDFTITLLSFVSLFNFAGNISALRTLRVFRALRVARILRRFPVVVRQVPLASVYPYHCLSLSLSHTHQVGLG